MSNIVIASKNLLCQSAKDWFVTSQHYQEGPPIDSLKDGENLIIIAHDSELGDGSGLVAILSKDDTPMSKFNVLLIVCSAASQKFGKNLVSPAECLANHFKRDVHAAKNLVFGKWDASGAVFTGEYVVVPWGSDVTVLMSKLNI